MLQITVGTIMIAAYLIVDIIKDIRKENKEKTEEKKDNNECNKRINKSKNYKKYSRGYCTEEDKGCTSTVFTVDLIGQCAKQGEHKHCKNIVKGHNKARVQLLHFKLVMKDKGYNGVVSLPECADEEECEAYKYGAFVVQFHKFLRFSLFCYFYFTINSALCQTVWHFMP